jgi:hypothetical protein
METTHDTAMRRKPSRTAGMRVRVFGLFIQLQDIGPAAREVSDS